MTFLKAWWPVLSGFVIVILALGRMQWQVQNLVDDSVVDETQSETLVEHEARLIVVEGKTESITQNSWEDWGRVKDAVQRHEEYIREHRRGHQ
jgi:hypothetical protein